MGFLTRWFSVFRRGCSECGYGRKNAKSVLCIRCATLLVKEKKKCCGCGCRGCRRPKNARGSIK